MKKIRTNEKIFKVYEYLHDKLGLIFDYDWIVIRTDELLDYVTHEDFIAIVDKLCGEEIIEMYGDWYSLAGESSALTCSGCKVWIKDTFNERYKALQQANDKSVVCKTDKPSFTYRITYKNYEVRLTSNHQVSCTLIKLRAGKQRDLFEYVYSKPNTALNKSMIMNDSYIELDDIDRLDQNIRNIFKSKSLLKLVFPTLSKDLITFKPEFTSSDMDGLAITHLET